MKDHHFGCVFRPVPISDTNAQVLNKLVSLRLNNSLIKPGTITPTLQF